LGEERVNGNVFPLCAVLLCTVSKEAKPRSRLVDTMLNENNRPKFHTLPASRKVKDITFNNKVSLTYLFQSALRPISIEGTLSALNDFELDQDWIEYDDFRRRYVVLGGSSGKHISTIETLRKKRDQQPKGVELVRPRSFIGYKFSQVDRISFYSVKKGGFAIRTLYKKESQYDDCLRSIHVP